MIPYVAEVLGGTVVVLALSLTASQFDSMKKDTMISELLRELESSQSDVFLCKSNSRTLRASIATQNREIEKLRITIKEFKPVTVTETIIKYIPADVNATRGNCEDTNLYLDYIRNNGIE